MECIETLHEMALYSWYGIRAKIKKKDNKIFGSVGNQPLWNYVAFLYLLK